MVTDEELKKVHGMFTDTWRLFKKYADVQKEDEYWKTMLAESRAIAEKYLDDKFCLDLILATVSELERKGMETQKQ